MPVHSSNTDDSKLPDDCRECGSITSQYQTQQSGYRVFDKKCQNCGEHEIRVKKLQNDENPVEQNQIDDSDVSSSSEDSTDTPSHDSDTSERRFISVTQCQLCGKFKNLRLTSVRSRRNPGSFPRFGHPGQFSPLVMKTAELMQMFLPLCWAVSPNRRSIEFVYPRSGSPLCRVHITFPATVAVYFGKYRLANSHFIFRTINQIKTHNGVLELAYIHQLMKNLLEYGFNGVKVIVPRGSGSQEEEQPIAKRTRSRRGGANPEQGRF